MLLDVKDLRVGYNGAEVLKGIAFSVYKGEVVTLIGANGAGKNNRSTYYFRANKTGRRRNTF